MKRTLCEWNLTQWNGIDKLRNMQNKQNTKSIQQLPDCHLHNILLVNRTVYEYSYGT